MKSICPQCGSAESRRRWGAQCVCRECGTRFTPPTSVWERLIFALIFFVPGLVFAVIGVVTIVVALEVAGPQAGGIFGCGTGAGVLALMCLVQGVRELIGHGKSFSDRTGGDSVGEALEDGHPQVLPVSPPLLPQEFAETLVREIAEDHGAKRILQLLGNLPQKHVDNAVACFAEQMADDETPLVQLDSSFLSNGKAGLLITNRGLYSSFYSHPVWLADIDEVSYAKPGVGDYLLSHLFGGLFYAFFFGFRRLQNRLLVNGKTVYATGTRLRSEFWLELLTELAEAARQMEIAESSEAQRPSVVVLETALRVGEDEAVELRQIRSPSRQDLERNIRALDQDSHPTLRIWAGEAEQAPALEILGGNGRYVLRERGDGWVFYDPSAGEEEVEVCTGHRAPAYYVCTDLQRVLEIAHHYVETGTPE